MKQSKIGLESRFQMDPRGVEAEVMIQEFGENVRVYSSGGQSAEDADNPVFFEDSSEETDYTEYKVRLYTAPSEEDMMDYGFEESSDAIMWSTKNIAGQGDRVEYRDLYEWTVESVTTNQQGHGPYIYVFSLLGV